MTTLDLLESLPEVAGRIDRAGSLLIGLDYDGTLTPIRPRPDEAVLSDCVRTVLTRLAGLSRVTLMIASGRSLADVAERVGLPELIYAGNHGLEIRGPGLDFVEPTATTLVAPLRELTSRLEERLREVPDVLVERKGLSVSIHYRVVPPEFWEEIEQVVQRAVASDPDRFVLTAGHRVWEIRPRVSWDKGQAVHWVLQQLGDSADRLVFFLGDDRTDEDVFVSMPESVTVKVGRPPLSTRARYHLIDPAAVERFLAWLAEKLSPAGKPIQG